MPYKKLLFVAYHFPPIQGSSGVHRSLSFAKYLPEHQWRPTVLTVHPRAYPSSCFSNLALVPEDLEVIRTFALDTRKHLSFYGRYPQLLALPDRWATWIPFAVRRGVEFVQKTSVDVIMSTFPIASASVIAHMISVRTGVPWLADLRDPMVTEGYPEQATMRRSFERLEAKIFRDASRVVVTTQGAANLYRRRFAAQSSRKLRVVENGVDTEMFANIDIPGKRNRAQGTIRLLHSGLVYREGRNPTPLLRSLGRLAAEGLVDHSNFRLCFRASARDKFIASQAERYGVSALVETLPESLDYQSALVEMVQADGLLLLQGKQFNDQIPAKVYEYLYARRPILALTEPAADTGRLLKRYGVECIGSLESDVSVDWAFREFLSQMKRGGFPEVPAGESLDALSRCHRAGELAHILNELV